jgi:hypothetical protein
MLGRSSIPVALYPQLAMALAAVLAAVAYPRAPLVRERFLQGVGAVVVTAPVTCSCTVPTLCFRCCCSPWLREPFRRPCGRRPFTAWDGSTPWAATGSDSGLGQARWR